jgi:hypothetical protein
MISALNHLIAMLIIREYVERLGIDSLQGFQERERWRGCFKNMCLKYVFSTIKGMF